MSGRRRDDQSEVVLVVEVSAGIGMSDGSPGRGASLISSQSSAAQPCLLLPVTASSPMHNEKLLPAAFSPCSMALFPRD